MNPDTVTEALATKLDSLNQAIAKLDSLNQAALDQSNSTWILICALGTLFGIVLVFLPILANNRIQKPNGSSADLRGLALPKGSVRSMLALLIIGSFMIVALIGGSISTLEENFTEVLSALSGIAGAVVGFYFGSKGSGKSE